MVVTVASEAATPTSEGGKCVLHRSALSSVQMFRES